MADQDDLDANYQNPLRLLGLPGVHERHYVKSILYARKVRLVLSHSGILGLRQREKAMLCCLVIALCLGSFLLVFASSWIAIVGLTHTAQHSALGIMLVAGVLLGIMAS